MGAARAAVISASTDACRTSAGSSPANTSELTNAPLTSTASCAASWPACATSSRCAIAVRRVRQFGRAGRRRPGRGSAGVRAGADYSGTRGAHCFWCDVLSEPIRTIINIGGWSSPMLGQTGGLMTTIHISLPDQLAHDAGELGLLDPVTCLLYTSPSPRDLSTSRMPSSA